MQGYNAQAVVTEHQIVVAAELTQAANDVQQLAPMLAAVDQTLLAAEIHERPGMVLADSGYWSIANLTTIPDVPELLVWPAKTGRTGKPRKDGQPSESRSDGLRAAMFAKLTSETGKARYAKRKQTVEPVFGQLKEQQAARRFTRRAERLHGCPATPLSPASDRAVVQTAGGGIKASPFGNRLVSVNRSAACGPSAVRLQHGRLTASRPSTKPDSCPQSDGGRRASFR